MGSQEEIPNIRLGDTAIHDGAVGDVARVRHVILVGWVEARLVAFDRHNDGDLGLIVSRVRALARGPDVRQLLVEDLVELALGNAISEDDDVLGEPVLVVLLPQPKPLDEFGLKVLVEHLDPPGLRPRCGWPLAQVFVDARHDPHKTGQVIRVSREVRRVRHVVADHHGLPVLDDAHIISQLVVRAAHLQVDLESDVGEELLVPVLQEVLAHHADRVVAELDVS